MIKDVIIHKKEAASGGPGISHNPGGRDRIPVSRLEERKMDLTSKDQQDSWNALERLLRIGRKDTGQARRVASFLLAWHNAEENGGWDPTDLWNVDVAIADDMLTVVRLIRDSHSYPDALGLGDEIAAVWRAWRGGQAPTESDRPAL
jgi:hypothetical protein